jgi:hypothetical protein
LPSSGESTQKFNTKRQHKTTKGSYTKAREGKKGGKKERGKKGRREKRMEERREKRREKRRGKKRGRTGFLELLA